MNFNLVEEGQELLLYQFHSSRSLNALLKAILEPLQELFDECQKLNHGNYIKEASEHRLDVLGEILNFPRNGLDDETYRIWLSIAILLNDSCGTFNDIYKILHALFAQNLRVRIDEYAPNWLFLSFLFDLKTLGNNQAVLFYIIRKALPLCTKIQFIDAADNEKPIFQFDVASFNHSAWAEFF